MSKWLVFYTKSRHEKKAFDLLIRMGFDALLPMQKIMRQWSDRKKLVEVPLFNSYLFVNTTEDQIEGILQTPGIAWNIRHNNKPAVLQARELSIIQQFMASGYFIETMEQQHLEIGDAVAVIGGPLKGLEGTLLRTAAGNKFSILLESIHQNMIVEIDPLILQLR